MYNTNNGLGKVGYLVFNITLNNLSAILWLPDWLKKTMVAGV